MFNFTTTRTTGCRKLSFVNAEEAGITTSGIYTFPMGDPTFFPWIPAGGIDFTIICGRGISDWLPYSGYCFFNLGSSNFDTVTLTNLQSTIIGYTYIIQFAYGADTLQTMEQKNLYLNANGQLLREWQDIESSNVWLTTQHEFVANTTSTLLEFYSTPAFDIRSAFLDNINIFECPPNITLTPTPTPTPYVSPTPIPTPVTFPEPAPQPIPQPVPLPSPQPLSVPQPIPAPAPAPALPNADACYYEFSSDDCFGASIYQQNLTFDSCNVITPFVIPDFGANLNSSQILLYVLTSCSTIMSAPGYDVCIDSLSGGSEVISLGNCEEPFLAPVPVPAPVPIPQPLPLPLPSPNPEPVPVPSPNPVPLGTPNPEPSPVPSPEPLSSPQPLPLPNPSPVPQPLPIPAPVPLSVPEPLPVPVPLPLPVPVPLPLPNPLPQPNPRPLPQPNPVPGRSNYVFLFQLIKNTLEIM